LDCGWHCGQRPVEVALLALSISLSQVNWLCLPGLLYVFLPDPRLYHTVRLLTKHSLLPISSVITDCLETFLLAPSSSVEFYTLSLRWSLPADQAYTTLEAEAQMDAASVAPSPHDLMIQEWQDSYPPPHLLPCVFGHAYRSLTCPDGTGPPPFVRGTLKALDCCLFSACLRASTRHTFTADYSICFRPSAGDETVCPCHRAGVDRELGLGSVDRESSVQPE
jgi:hypothetical protein